MGTQHQQVKRAKARTTTAEDRERARIDKRCAVYALKLTHELELSVHLLLNMQKGEGAKLWRRHLPPYMDGLKAFQAAINKARKPERERRRAEDRKNERELRVKWRKDHPGYRLADLDRALGRGKHRGEAIDGAWLAYDMWSMHGTPMPGHLLQPVPEGTVNTHVNKVFGHHLTGASA